MKKNKSSKFTYMDRSLIKRMGGKAFIIKLDSQNNIRLHNFNINQSVLNPNSVE